jgi:Zn-dependent protease
MDLAAMLVVFQVVVLVAAFTVHECAHAYAAYRLGDATAYLMGRVTLNPVKHIDPWGSIVMPAIALVYGWPLLGWAKPCPVTLRNFRKMKKYDIITTFAGPASNLAMALLALVGLLVLKHLPGFGHDAVYTAMDLTNPYLRNQIDTTQLPKLFPLAVLLYYGILTNALLFVFNLIPIPPLDGSRIIRYYLPYKVEQMYDRIGNFGILIVFFFAGRFILPIFLTPLLGAFDAVLERM